jgi:hypothetical protein
VTEYLPDEAEAARSSSLSEFYPRYLAEHSNPVSRSLHIAGSTAVIALGVAAIMTRKPRLLLAMPIVGYGFAWAGHFLFERNKPATFKQPLYSLASDFLMMRDTLLGRLPPSPTSKSDSTP